MTKVNNFILVTLFVLCQVSHCHWLDSSALSKFKDTNTSCTSNCCMSLKSRESQTYYFYQDTGRFVGGSPEYRIDTKTYSGTGKGYLNPDMQCTNHVGPLPATTYFVGGCLNKMAHEPERPCSFYLEPKNERETCGRSSLDMFVHGCQCCTPGDDPEPPAAGCSTGSIIMNYANRIKLRIGDTIIVQNYEPKVLEYLEEEKIEQK